MCLSKDLAWYTANIGRLLPSYRDIEVEEALPRLEAERVHDTDIPVEVPFVPQSMLDEQFQPELPPPPAGGPGNIQGEIRLHEDVREEILQA